jgi:phosphoglycerate dehydrogenase-like enzyme
MSALHRRFWQMRGVYDTLASLTTTEFFRKDMMPNVLCTALNTDTGPHLALLEAAGFTVRHPTPGAKLYDSQVLLSEAQNCAAVIAGSEPWPRWLIESLPGLRVLSRTGVGFDAIDLAACDERRVVVTTTPGVNHHAVAEHTISLLMGVARGFPFRDQQVRKGPWKRIPSPRVMGRTLGIVGLGRIGRAVATRAAGLGMQLIAYDPYPPVEFAEQWRVQMTSLDELFSQADYITLHLPMGPDVKHLINAKSIALMKPEAVIINTARGSLINERDLAEALRTRRLRAAGLDVFEVEPLPLDSPLLSLDNVLLSGHVAGLDHESQFDTLSMAADTIVQLREGRWPAERIRNLVGVTDWHW